VVVTYSADCNNPLIDSTMVGILKEPVTADANLKFCPSLAGKPICCDTSAMTEFVKKIKAKNKSFSNKRQKQVKDLDEANSDNENPDNMEMDSALEVDLEESKLENEAERILTGIN